MEQIIEKVSWQRKKNSFTCFQMGKENRKKLPGKRKKGFTHFHKWKKTTKRSLKFNLI